MSLIMEQEIRDWFVEGRGRDASYLMVVYDIREQVCRPIFVHREQVVTREVIRIVNDASLSLRAVLDLDLHADMDVQVKMAASMNIVTSRICN